MIDRSLTIEDPANNHGDPPNHLAESLEQRIHRLEDAVAALQDTQIMEERIMERVIGKVRTKKDVDGTGIVEAERRTAAPRTPVPQAVATPVPPAPSPPPPAPSVAGKRSWVIIEVFRDIRTGLGMFFDPRYRASWSAYISLMILAYVLVSHWLWSLWAGVPLLGLLSVPIGIPVVGAILDKAVGLVFALFAFKCLAREMHRYKEAISGRPTYSRY
jgi:hypothetical protein